ncbi:hypothetical protein CL634_04985 [bacterium]|nr:hypothetical protein [bacterium]|tara:strand:+ start:133 stop:939 length:807 start_codon:yes stop_codon:yes gene_type:complete
MKATLITFCGVEYDLPLLVHFIKHYRRLGIIDIAIILQSSIDGPHLSEAIAICYDHGIEPYELWIGEYTSQEMYERRMGAIQDLNPDWVIHADIDEFHEYPSSIMRLITSKKYNAIQGVFVDRVSSDGSIIHIDSEKDIQEQFPIKCNFMKKWYYGQYSPPTGTVKMMAYRPHLNVSRGGHAVDGGGVIYSMGYDLSACLDIKTSERKRSTPYKIHHFKWHGNILDKLKNRIKVYKKHGYAWWETSQNTINYFERNDGVINTDELEKI